MNCRIIRLSLGLIFAACCMVNGYVYGQNYVTIPLTAEEYGGVTGTRRITCGVPLIVGQIKDIGELRLFFQRFQRQKYTCTSSVSSTCKMVA